MPVLCLGGAAVVGISHTVLLVGWKRVRGSGWSPAASVFASQFFALRYLLPLLCMFPFSVLSLQLAVSILSLSESGSYPVVYSYWGHTILNRGVITV
jgi:hypothetical protein